MSLYGLKKNKIAHNTAYHAQPSVLLLNAITVLNPG